MKLSILMALLIVLPVAAHAEVHKYKDTHGNWVYSDVAPPPGVKQETIGRKSPQPTNAAPMSKVLAPTVADKTPLTKDQAAAKRQQVAEEEKKNSEAKETQDKQKEATCKLAKENLAAYTQGGRMFKINENGEREYLDSKAIDANKEKAQKDVNDNCS